MYATESRGTLGIPRTVRLRLIVRVQCTHAEMTKVRYVLKVKSVPLSYLHAESWVCQVVRASLSTMIGPSHQLSYVETLERRLKVLERLFRKVRAGYPLPLMYLLTFPLPHLLSLLYHKTFFHYTTLLSVPPRPRPQPRSRQSNRHRGRRIRGRGPPPQRRRLARGAAHQQARQAAARAG